MIINLTKIFEELEKVGFVGLMLIWMSFLVGLKFPDWDFKLKIKHRNILTHSPLILWLMIYFYHSQNDAEVFRFAIMGFSLAMGLHMIFDFFPKGWARGALIYFPYCKICLGVQGSKVFIFLTVVYSMFISIKYSKTYVEIICLSLLGIYTIVKKTKYEEKFFRPFSFFVIVILFLGAIKYKEISNSLMYLAQLVSNKIGTLL